MDGLTSECEMPQVSEVSCGPTIWEPASSRGVYVALMIAPGGVNAGLNPVQRVLPSDFGLSGTYGDPRPA